MVLNDLDAAVGHLRAGRPGPAEAIARRMLAERPDDPDALHLLGVVATLAGKAEHARALIRKAIAAKPDDPTFHFSLGNAVRLEANPGGAAEAYRHALELKPDFVEALLNLAIALQDLGRPEDSLAAYRRLVNLAPGMIEGQVNLGNLLCDLHLYDEAIAAFRRALELRPDLAEIHSNMGNALLAQGREDDALEALRRAARMKPGWARGHFNLGVALHHLERLDEAEACYRQAIALGPPMADCHFNLARVLEGLGDLGEAERELRRAVEIDPDYAEAHARLATLLLHDGQSGAAAALCSEFLARHPGACSLLAVKAQGLREAPLLDFDRLLRVTALRAAPGFGDVAALNAALEDHVLVHPTLVYDPQGLATRGGRQSGPLSGARNPATAALEQAIREAVTDYLSALTPDAGHPFLAAAPERWRLRAWATVLEAQGRQLPHIHPSAWLSGVYYVRLPDTIGRDPDCLAGAIEFGRPPAELSDAADPPVAVLRPQEGMLVLFPSYLYHRTLPFEGDQRRISIAFDIIPRP